SLPWHAPSSTTRAGSGMRPNAWARRCPIHRNTRACRAPSGPAPSSCGQKSRAPPLAHVRNDCEPGPFLLARRLPPANAAHCERAGSVVAWSIWGAERRSLAMGWSIKLFDVGGTAVRIHLTFFLLLAWIAAIHWSRGGAPEAVDGVLFIIALFVCVVLHEFGHIVAARRYGIRTPDVTLLPIGGVASLERMPEKPSQEIVGALAGPAVNLLIALVLMFVLGAKFDLSQMAQLEQAQTSLVGRIAAANVMLLVFNLIPAFPMDGGRVLRALLAIGMGYTRATRVAGSIGQGLAVLFAFLGLMGNPLLVLIAVFIF